MTKLPTDLIRYILRLLTPEEINGLTTTTKRHKSVPLTEVMMAQLKGIPLDLEKISQNFHNKTKEKKIETKVEEEETTKEEEKEKEIIVYPCAKNVVAVLAEYVHHCKKAEKEILGPNPRKKRRPPKKQLSRFIIEEKKKLEELNLKSKRQEIIQLYQKTSKVNLEQQKRMKDDLSKSDLSGILV